MCDQQCCGSGMFIPDPNFFFPDSGSSLQSGLPWYVFSLSRSGFPKRCGSNRIRIQKHWMLLQSTYLQIPESWLSAPFIHKINVADPGCLSRILDPNVYIPDPYKRKYCNLKMVSWLFIPDLDPDFLPIPDPGVKKSQDPKSRIRIRSIAQNLSIRNTIFNSVADPWWLPGIPDSDFIHPGSGSKNSNKREGWKIIFIMSSVADPDPGSDAFLTPGSGIRKRFFPDLGSQIHIFESLVTIILVKSYIILWKLAQIFFFSTSKLK